MGDLRSNHPELFYIEKDEKKPTKKRNINNFDLEVVEKLKMAHEPISYKMAMILLDDTLTDVEVLRAFSDCIIELEIQKNETLKELIEYRMRYGELDQ